MLIITCDGIGTAGVSPDDSRSILGHVSARLSQKTGQHRIIPVNWPASMAGIGGPQSWTVAAHMGVLELDKITREHPDQPLILLAYSGGNRVVHDWLDTRPEMLDRVAAVGLMSDPYRPRDRQQHGLPRTRGWGICGERHGPIPARSFWVTNPGDVISDALPDSLLRTVADLSDQIPGGLLADLAGHHHRGDWQLLWQLGILRTNPLGWLGTLGSRLDQARRDIDGYLSGDHTTGYTKAFSTPDGKTTSLAHRLADSIAWSIRNRV